MFAVKAEDFTNLFRLGVVDDQFGADQIVAEQRSAAGPLALAAGRRDLVPRPFGDDLPLELGERQQHVQDQSAHARGGVELLGDGDEADAAFVE